MIRCIVTTREGESYLTEDSENGETLVSLAGRVMTKLFEQAHPRHMEWCFREVSVTQKFVSRRWDGRKYHQTLSTTLCGK